MTQSLNGKVAIVTGASSGIGRAVAIEFARQGVKQVLTARSADRLSALAHELHSDVVVLPADMTRASDVEKIVEETISKFGRIDILLANAGIYLSGDVIDGEPDAWDELIATNVTGVFRLVHAVLPHMKAQRQGDILSPARYRVIRQFIGSRSTAHPSTQSSRSCTVCAGSYSPPGSGLGPLPPAWF